MTDLGSYATLRVRVDDGVAFATIDNPPTPEAHERMARFLEIGGQNRELEVTWDLDQVASKLGG